MIRTPNGLKPKLRHFKGVWICTDAKVFGAATGFGYAPKAAWDDMIRRRKPGMPQVVQRFPFLPTWN